MDLVYVLIFLVAILVFCFDRYSSKPVENFTSFPNNGVNYGGTTHEVAGGYCQSFTLEGYCFSPGVHYVGGMQPGGDLRGLYEGLGVSRNLEFCELNPDGYDHIFIGEERFDIPANQKTYIERLKSKFPHERKGIEAYFKKVFELVDIVHLSFSKDPSVKWTLALQNLMTQARWGFASARGLIDHHITNPFLRAILASQCGDSGLPPSQLSAMVHAAVVDYYINGGWFPRGGAFTIPRAFGRELRRAGGEIRRKTEVESIILEDHHVIGVRLADGQEIRSDYVVSNADAEVTFGKLIGREKLSGKLRRKLDRTIYSTSNLSLFLAVDMDLRAAGLDSGNFWYYDHADLETIYTQCLGDHILKAKSPPILFVSATTLKDPTRMIDGHHILEVLAFTSYQPFKQWEDQKTGQRDLEYQKLKQRLTDKMLTGLENRIPGIRDHLVFYELATPLTNRDYVKATQGHMYGTAKIRSQVGPNAYPIRTEFEGLYCCGASTLNHGVVAATVSGLMAAGEILDCHMSDLLQRNGPPVRTYPSENLDGWPQHLKRRIYRGRVKELA